MGKASYKLQKHVRQEEATIQAAARKRGLWGSVGSTLGSVLAMAVTGGAAAPLVAGLLAGISLPKLAEGGIVTKPTLAMVGEGGESEAVIPLFANSALNCFVKLSDIILN